MEEASQPKKRSNKDDFDLDSFDLNEPPKKSTKFNKVNNNDDDDFGLDDLDFGGGTNNQRKPKPKK